MTEFFDFMRNIPPYSENETTIRRLNNRHRLLVAPFVPQISGARVLDLACHDGRWSYALAAAGATHVHGVEARPELISRFNAFPDTPFKSRVNLQCNDLFAELEQLVAGGARFDVIAVFGIFYHIMDHFRLLSLAKRLHPRIIIIDSEFITLDNAMIQLLKEEVANPLNATADAPGLTHTVVGVPSRRATGFMAEALDMEITWLDHDLILGDDREGMHDYFREGRKTRGTCVLCGRDGD